MASFSNDDCYKVGFAGLCFLEAILFLLITILSTTVLNDNDYSVKKMYICIRYCSDVQY